MTRDELWSRLASAGLVQGPMPAVSAVPATPWYVSAMVGIAAWIASIFLLAFLGAMLSGILRDGKSTIVVGAILCAVCAVLLRTRRNNLFVEQLVLAASLAGQGLIAFGLLEGQWRSPAAWLAVSVVEIAWVAAAPPPMQRVLATLAAACAVRFSLAHAGLGELFAPLVAVAFVLGWADAHHGSRHRVLWQPVTGGLALAALLVVPASLADVFAWHGRAAPIGGDALSWAAAIVLAVVLLAAIVVFLREAGAIASSRAGMLALAAGAAVALAARPVAGLVVALIVLLVAFSEGRRALMGLAVFGMIGALVRYYYELDATLLTKAGALLATGIVLLVAGAALRLGLAEPEQRHA